MVTTLGPCIIMNGRKIAAARNYKMCMLTKSMSLTCLNTNMVFLALKSLPGDNELELSRSAHIYISIYLSIYLSIYEGLDGGSGFH